MQKNSDFVLKKNSSGLLSYFLTFFFISLILLIISQVVKYYVLHPPFHYWETMIIENNDGLFWGTVKFNQTIMILQFVFLGILQIIILLQKEVWAIIGYLLIWTGGLGNLVNRIWNNGSVVDYLSFDDVFIFDLEDVLILFGIWVILLFYVKKLFFPM